MVNIRKRGKVYQYQFEITTKKMECHKIMTPNSRCMIYALMVLVL